MLWPVVLIAEEWSVIMFRKDRKGLEMSAKSCLFYIFNQATMAEDQQFRWYFIWFLTSDAFRRKPNIL